LPRRRPTVTPGRGRDCWPVSIRPTNGSPSAPRRRRHAEDIRCSTGTSGILPFMAKWTLGILDGRGWGVDGVTTVCGRDCIAVACYVQQWITWTQPSEQNQTTADIRNHEQISKVLQF